MRRLIYIFLFGILVHISWKAKAVANDTTKSISIVSPSSRVVIIDSLNVIYCSSFHISWNSLQENIFKGPILVDKVNWWIDDLNRDPKNSTLSKEHFSAFSGFAKDKVIIKFQDDLKERFNYSYNSTYSFSEFDIVSFAFMKKKIKFYTNLYQIRSRELMFNGKKDVVFFGLNSGWDASEALKIHDYMNNDDFILQIETEDEIDEIFFAKIQPERTLIDCYNTAMDRVKKGNGKSINEKDQLGIPYINFHIEKEFDEILGARILNPGFEKYSFQKAIQIIDFNLNETGISVESITEVNAVFGLPKKVEPRELNFDKPFLIIMKEKASDLPYFLMWVGNHELMSRK